MHDLIPPPDPLGVPSHPLIFQFLYILTFFLHIVFMNYILGGSVIVAVNEWFMGKKPLAVRGNALLVKVMPFALSLAITMGVAPLLFVQVMYGQFFYTSNIMLGWWWLAILVLVTTGFYLLYVMIAKRPDESRSTPWMKAVTLINVVLFMSVAFIFTNNAILTENPEYMRAMHTGESGFPVPDPTLWPRYLHNFVAALAVAGLWAAVIGRYQKRHYPARADVGSFLETAGLWWAAIPTGIQFVIGTWYLLSIDLEQLRQFMRGGVLFWGWSLSLLFALGSLILIILALVKPEKPKLLWLAVGHVAATLIGMVMGRDLLRVISLSDYFRIEELTVRPSVSSLLLFLVTFVAGLAVLGYMIKLVWSIPPADAGKDAHQDG